MSAFASRFARPRISALETKRVNTKRLYRRDAFARAIERPSRIPTRRAFSISHDKLAVKPRSVSPALRMVAMCSFCERKTAVNRQIPRGGGEEESGGTSECALSSRGSWRNFHAESAVDANGARREAKSPLKVQRTTSLFSFLHSSRYIYDIHRPTDAPSRDTLSLSPYLSLFLELPIPSCIDRASVGVLPADPFVEGSARTWELAGAVRANGTLRFSAWSNGNIDVIAALSSVFLPRRKNVRAIFPDSKREVLWQNRARYSFFYIYADEISTRHCGYFVEDDACWTRIDPSA